jgi:preprotein translocase subunit SecA
LFHKLLSFFDRNAYRREVTQYAPTLARVNALEARFRELSDSDLPACTEQLRQRAQKGASQEELLPEAFAAVREAARRTIGLRPYDVQIIGGIVLARGAIAEMRTGEGKTLVATLPLYLNALEGRGAHLVTVNDYLARRDARWMGSVFHLLGMSVGVLQADEPGTAKRLGYLYDPKKQDTEERLNLLRRVSRAEAYRADITYGTNSEFGFDYLRDNLAPRLEDKAQREHYFAIVDEVDNILIDEARTPLIISGENRNEIEWYSRMAEAVRRLSQREVEINHREQIVSLTPGGEKHITALLGRPLGDPNRPEEASLEQRHLIGHLEQALRARFLHQRDREYIIQDGKVVIVDEYTGRMMPGRRWTDGLHQAVEAKEGLEVQSESITYATVSLQNYFRMYARLSGMTGTALTATQEFEKIYKLKVHPIPTHVEYQALGQAGVLLERQGSTSEGQDFTYYVQKNDPQSKPVFWRRVDYPDVLYPNLEAKRRAIVWEILRQHACGRPLLVGTTSVADSEELARYMEGPLLTRLVQTRLLRQAWLKAHPKAHPDLPAEALKFLNTPLGLVNPARLASAFESLELSPDPLTHLPELLRLLDLPAEHQPGLEASLRDGIPSVVLNARYHYEESQIIASAGAYGSVIIATNMAGRGVDIKLGGELAEEVLAAVNHVLEQAGMPDPYSMTLAERSQALLNISPAQREVHPAEVDFFLNYMKGMERVKELGGLHVIGGTRHEARRIDHQLRGRAARQGDPGSSRFFVSMEDDLLVRFGSLEAEAFLEQEELRGGDPLLPCPAEAGRRVIEVAQNRVENENYEIRKHLLDYDDVINAQRLAIYKQRDRILGKPDLGNDLAEMLEAELSIQAAGALQAEGQSWQFIAWVERLQPGLERADGSLVSSWPLEVALQRGLPDLPQQVDAGQARAGLLRLAERALSSEQRFVEAETGRQCQAALAGWQAAVAERMEAVDALLDSLNPGSPAGRSRAVTQALSEAAGMPIQLSDAGWRALKENPRAAGIEVLNQIEAALFQDAAAHVWVILERLLGQIPAIDPAGWPPLDPQDLPTRAQAAVLAAFQARRERLLGPQGELARRLEENLAELDGPLGERCSLELMELMRMPGGETPLNEASAPDEEGSIQDSATATGDVQIAPPTPMPAFLHLTYIFLADELLENTPPDEIAEQALDHLLGVQQALMEDLGAETLNEAYRELLLASIDERWIDYLTRLEELRYEVRLEGMAHNDPLVMYKSKASGAYGALLAELRRVAVAQMFTFPIVSRLTGSAEASSLEKATPKLTYLKLG